VAGVDGCRSGWVVVLRECVTGELRARVAPAFDAVLALAEAPRVVGVDMPIGLLPVAAVGGRTCEVLARRLLGPRSSSLFSAPTRSALEAFRAGGGYRAVSLANRGTSSGPGLSRQAFGLLSKISEVDRALPTARCRIVEVHPELSFREANGGRVVETRKRTPEGRRERLEVLARHGYTFPLALLARPGRGNLPAGAKPDDLLDACVACWTAERVARGTAVVLPGDRPLDARGLRMELWR